MSEDQPVQQSSEDIFRLQELLVTHRTTLYLLLSQEAMYGSAAVPPAVEHNIRAARAAIQQIKQALQALGVVVQDIGTDEEGYAAPEMSALPAPSVDPDIKSHRIAAYIDLWARLKPLAKYDRMQPITRTVITGVTESLRDWYFDVGGLFLSSSCRLPYFALKEGIRQILENVDPLQTEVLTNAELGEILQLASELRTCLAQDLGSR